MSDDYPVLFTMRESQADAISENFNLAYNEEFIHSMLLESITEQFREVAKVHDEMTRLNVDGLAALIAEEISHLLRAHLDRTVRMSIFLLLAVAHKLAQASLYDLLEQCGRLAPDNVRAFRPSKDDMTKEPINVLLSQWLDGFGVTMRSRGRKSKAIASGQLEIEGHLWLHNARAVYVGLKRKDLGNLGLALGYGRGEDGGQNKDAARKTLTRTMERYGYTRGDITTENIRDRKFN